MTYGRVRTAYTTHVGRFPRPDGDEVRRLRIRHRAGWTGAGQRETGPKIYKTKKTRRLSSI